MADKEARANIRLARWEISIGATPDRLPIMSSAELTLGYTLTPIVNQRLGDSPIAHLRSGAFARGKVTVDQASETEIRYLAGLASSGNVGHGAAGTLETVQMLRWHDPHAGATATGDLLVHAAALFNWMFPAATGKGPRQISFEFVGEIDATTGLVWSVGAAVPS